jgi:hypothetical protein
MAKETFYPVQGEKRTRNTEGQVSRIRANVEVGVYEFKEIPHKFVTVNLAGSNIAAGQLAYDQKDKRGFYLHQLKVLISTDSEEYYIQKDAPGTSEGRSQFTTTCQLGINLQAGTFGDVPTTGVGGTFSIGESITQDLSDFRTVNDSTERVAQHIYHMSATKDGTPYTKPEDLLDTTIEGQLTGTPLHSVPYLAIDNFGIPSQAIYVSHKPGAGDLQMNITMESTLMYVEKTNEVFVAYVSEKPITWHEDFNFTISASKVIAD